VLRRIVHVWHGHQLEQCLLMLYGREPSGSGSASRCFYLSLSRSWDGSSPASLLAMVSPPTGQYRLSRWRPRGPR
jgi:hypothetical protein